MSDKEFFGAKKMLAKAQSRLAVLNVMENNQEGAQKLFSELKKTSDDWRLRTYASHWLKRNNSSAKSENLLDCGTRALSAIFKNKGELEAAKNILNVKPGDQGFNIEQLSELANKHGESVSAVKVDKSKLDKAILPMILQIDRSSNNGAGHYWILESFNNNMAVIHDPQMDRRFQQTDKELSAEWQGNAIVFSTEFSEFAIELSQDEQSKAFGGCCGVQRPESDLGPFEDSGNDCAQGAPVWSINPVNMNMYVQDIPLWYTPSIGPKIKIDLSFNSQSAIAQNEPFGNKWMFNYASYIVTDPAKSLVVFEANGARSSLTPIIGENKQGSCGNAKNCNSFPPPYPGYPPEYLIGYNQIDSYSVTILRENNPQNPHFFNKIIGYRLDYKDGSSKTYGVPPGTTALQHFILEIKDKDGHKLTFNYDENARMTGIVDALGSETRLIYNQDGLVEQVLDPFSRSAIFTYDENRNLTSLTDMQGYTASIGYDEDRYITYIEDAKGRTQFYTEPADGDTSVGSNSYPDFGSPMWENYRITITDPLGQKEEYHYDGYAGKSWYVSKEHYNEQGNKNSIKTIFELTSVNSRQGKVSKTIYPDGSFIAKEFSPGAQEVSKITNHLGQEESFEYNSKGRITKYTNNLGQVTEYTYGENLLDIAEITSPEGVISYTYDDKRRITSKIDFSGGVTQFTYNQMGQLHTVTNPLNEVTESHYDENHRITHVTKAEQKIGVFEYDSIGRVVSSADLHGNTTQYAYNNIGTLVEMTYPDGNKVERQYGSCPRMLLSETLPGGRTTQFTYDANKQLIKVTDPKQASVQFSFNKNGEMTALKDQSHNETQFERNDSGQITKKQYADQSSLLFTLDKGRIVNESNARGQVTTYIYDDKQQLSKIQFSDGSPEIVMAYNVNGQLKSVIDSQGTHNYTYYTDGKLASYDSPLANDLVNFSYDVLGRTSAITINQQAYQTFTYDHLGRLSQLNAAGSEFNWQYQDNRTAQVQPSVTVQYPNTIEGVFTQNSQGQLSNISYEKEPISLISYDLSYNNMGLLASLNSSRDELIDTSAQQIKTHNNLNQLVHSSAYPDNFTYDADGNMVSGYLPQGEKFTASYDIKNRLTQLNFSRNGQAYTETFKYYYNDMLARYQLNIDGVVTQDTRFLRLGVKSVQEFDASGAITATNYWLPSAPGGVGGLIKRTQATTDYFYHYDHNGNPVKLTDNSGQQVADMYYSRYGKVLGGNNPTPIGFSTKRKMASGLNYYGYRFYMPHLGRWLNRDPIGEADDINLYAMVGGDPVNKIDPTGEFGLLGGGIGLLTDLGMQLAQNGGKLSCVNIGQLAAAGISGALTGGLGRLYAAKNIPKYLKSLNRQQKGRIGEKLSEIKHRIKGSKLEDREYYDPLGRHNSRIDFRFKSRNGKEYFVESKFGTAGLTNPQKGAKRVLGDQYNVEKWTYPKLKNMSGNLGEGLGGALGGAGTNAAGSNSGCGC